jgi:YidC/Oxa1 family membrane protein insertase
VTEIWTQIVLQPMLNAMLLLYNVFGQNFAAAIAILTVAIRLITLPLTLPQQKSAKKMQEIQPQMQALQKKHKDDKEKLAQAQMELYKEAGVNPLGGCLPMLVQFPIWIGLYQSISRVIGAGPLQLVDLATNVYAGLLPLLSPLVPIKSQFLWLDLGTPDPLYILPVLVVTTSWFQQKVMTAPSTDAQSSSMNQSMQIMMPLMMGFFSLQFSSGLSLYFVISNVVGIVIQYFTPGWVGVSFGQRNKPATVTARPKASSSVTSEPVNASGEPSDTAAKKGRRYGKKKRKRRS